MTMELCEKIRMPRISGHRVYPYLIYLKYINFLIMVFTEFMGNMLKVRTRELREFPHETQGFWPRWKADALYRWKAGQKS